MVSDEEFIYQISGYLDKFHKGNGNTYHFRCPYCGDSAKDKYKTRGNLYFYQGTYLFNCYNCYEKTNLYGFLNYMNPELAKEYAMQTYIGQGNKKKHYEEQKAFEKDEKKKSILSEFTPIESLAPSHSSRKYLKSRMVDDVTGIHYCPDSTYFLEKYSKEKAFDDKPKLAFPLVSADGVEFGVQFRSLDSSSKLRYRTCIFNVKYHKIWGMNYAKVPDGVINKKTLYVLEGIIDAKMLDNAVAALDASLHTICQKMKFPREHTVLVFDNEPRNRSVVNNMIKAANDGWKIALWNTDIKAKDLNQAKINGEETTFLTERVYQGPRLLLEINNWKNV